MSDVEAVVMRKVAWRLIPYLCIGYVINALDRYNVSIAALTMNKDLGLSAAAYGMAAGAYFWSYVLCQVPANLTLRKLGARTWLSIIMAVWGLASAGTALVKGETSFVIARFLLGMAEAGYFPGVTYFMTCWFPARYRGRMMGCFFAAGAISSVIGAPLSAHILQLDGRLGIAGWQWVFLAEGAPAVILALFGYTVLRNHPAEAPWLAPAERDWLQDRLDAEAAQKPTHGRRLLPSILNLQIVAITIAFTCILYGVYSISFFLPLIIKGLGLSNLTVGYVSALPSLCAAVGMILISRSSDRTGERFWHVLCPVTVGALGLLAAAFSLGQRLRGHGGLTCRCGPGPVIHLAGVLEPAHGLLRGGDRGRRHRRDQHHRQHVGLPGATVHRPAARCQRRLPCAAAGYRLSCSDRARADR